MTTIKITTNTPENATILAEIMMELERAEKKHPKWPADLIHMDAIINEEKGEVTRAVLQHVYEGGPISDVREELIQTAAMCVRMLKNLRAETSKKIKNL